MIDKIKQIIVVVATLFGAGEAEPVQIEEPAPIYIEEKAEEAYKAPVIEEEVTVEEEEEPRTVTDGKFEYPVREDFPEWAPVLGNDTISETVTKGVSGQISTIWGNGIQGQNERNMDHPRSLQLDSKGNIYFVDGDQRTAKLRMFDGSKNRTIVDLVDNRLMDGVGHFFSAGLAIIHDNVYISSTEDIYMVKDNRITQLDLKIRDWMKKNRFERIYRMEGHGDYLYMMVQSKSYYYAFVRYNVRTKEMELVLDENTYPAPYNFYIYGDNDIFITTENGYIVWEQIFPRQTKNGLNTGDRMDRVLDMWIGEDMSMYYSVMEDKMYNYIYRNPQGSQLDNLQLVAGNRRGFVDGVRDEVEMDMAIDFIWDGSGYIFADMNNHTIRKLWMDVAPK